MEPTYAIVEAIAMVHTKHTLVAITAGELIVAAKRGLFGLVLV